MQKNYIEDIGILAHLIQVILYSRLEPQKSFNRIFNPIIDKLEAARSVNKHDMKYGLELISKYLKNSVYKVKSMLDKHFKTKTINRYSVQVVIFSASETNIQSFHNKQVLQRWIFKKQTLIKFRKKGHSADEGQNDLILTLLKALRNQTYCIDSLICCNQKLVNKKSYQLIIKSKCKHELKQKTYLLHHQGQQIDLKEYRHHFSVLEFQNCWEKVIRLNKFTDFSLKSYFVGKKQKIKIEPKLEIQTETQQLKNPPRKLSYEANTEESTSSFKLNFSCRVGKQFIEDENKPFLGFGSRRHRIHSIYESKDQQMGVYILSPRKLSQEQSPKIKNFQQKTIKFSLDEQNNILEEDALQQFCLEPSQLPQHQNQNKSQFSSCEFQILSQENMDIIIQETSKSKKLPQHLIQKISIIQKDLLNVLESIDNIEMFY